MRNSGYNTKSKQMITEYLQKNRENTVTAEDIARYLESVGEPVNITTVYRHLDKLVAEQQVMKHAKDDGKGAAYRYIGEDSECRDHLHLQCTDCGKVLHLDCGYMEEIIEHISREHSFDLKCSSSILYGKCRDCANNRESK